MKNFLHKLKRLIPKFYVCRDVVVMYWLDFEVVFRRWFTDDWRW